VCALCVVVTEKLYVTGTHHLYVIIAAALAAPIIITIIIIMLVVLHRYRWFNWRKRSLHASKMTLSQVAVQRQQLLTSQALQQSLQPADARWELNPALYVQQE